MKFKVFKLYLDLHPTLKIIPEEVGGHGMEHVNLEWTERDGLFIEIIPSTSQLPGLIPNFLDQRIILDDDRVLHKSPGRGWTINSIRIGRGRHPTSIQVNVKSSTQMSRTGSQVDTMWVRVVTL